MKTKFAVLIFLISSSIFGQNNSYTQVGNPSKINHFIFNPSFGPSFRLAKAPKGLNSEQAKYIKDLKSGFSYDISLYYTGNGKNGFGIKYNKYRSKATLLNQEVYAPNGDYGFGNVSDDINITFIGPSFLLTDETNDGNFDFKVEIALGYMGYLNKSYILGKYDMEGSTFGMIGGLGFNYKIAKNFSVGPQVNFVGGTMKTFNIFGENGYQGIFKYPKNEYESLWRIDLGLNAIIKF